ncbi:MAG: O-antigen ligase family protein, partial [Clostridia bacterium]
MEIKKDKIQNVIDIIIMVLLAFIGIKKGGFYKTDSLIFELLITILSAVYMCFKNIQKSKYKERKFDTVGFLLLLLPIFYTLPVIFKNYANLNESIFEIIRYFNLYTIYKIAKNSNNKKIYKSGIIVIGTIFCIFGLDGVGNRYFSNILSKFDSGYLDLNRTRMSGTIQYANTFALFVLIAYIFLQEKITCQFNMMKNKKKIPLFSLYYTLAVLMITCIILSGSRMVFFLLLSTLVITYFMCKRKLNIFAITVSFIEAIIFSNIISILMVNEPKLILLIVAFSFIINIFCIYIMLKFSKKNVYSNMYKKLSKLKVSYFFCFAISAIIALNIRLPFTMAYNKNVNSVDKYIYNLEKGSNLLELDILSEGDSRYSINILKKNKDGTEKFIKNIAYYNTTTGKFKIYFEADETDIAIHLNINSQKGNFKISNVRLNSKEKSINYALVPYEFIYKLQDAFSKNTSIRDRLEYYKDSLKIIFKTPLNIFVGVGAGGFNDLYDSVQTLKYSSTKVHSSFLQIFLESGVFSFIIIIIAIILAVIRSKKYTKLALLILVLHSIVDLNFSYFFIIITFAIIMGMQDEIKIEKCKETHTIAFKVLNIIEDAIYYSYTLVIAVILIKANYAYEIKIPKYEKQTIQNQMNVVKVQEKRVNLDTSENIYREELSLQYSNYLKMLLSEYSKNTLNINLKEEISNIL